MREQEAAMDKVLGGCREDKIDGIKTLVKLGVSVGGFKGVVRELVRVVVERERVAALVCEADVVRGKGTDAVADDIIRILYRTLVDGEGAVGGFEEAFDAVPRVDIEVFFRNISLKRTGATAQQAAKILSITLFTVRKRTGHPTCSTLTPTVSADIGGQLGYCEVYERNKILRNYWELSNTLGVLSHVKQGDLKVLGMMLKAHGRHHQGDFAETSEEDVTLATKIIGSWCMAALHPFYESRVPFFDPEMLEEVLDGLFHVGFHGEPRWVLEEESIVVLKLLAMNDALLPTVAEKFPYHRFSTRPHPGWLGLLAQCATQRRAASWVLSPSNKILPCLATILSTQERRDDTSMTHATAVLASVSSSSQENCVEMMSSGSLTATLPEFLKEIVSEDVKGCSVHLITNICVLYGGMLPHVDTMLIGRMYTECLCEILKELYVEKKYDKATEQILTAFTLSADGRQNVKTTLTSQVEVFEAVAEIVIRTEIRSSLNEAAMGVLAVCSKRIPSAAVEILTRDLVRITKGYIAVGSGDVYTIPIGCLVVGACTGQYDVTAEVVPWLLDTAWRLGQGEARGARDLFNVVLTCLGKFCSTSDEYQLTIAWRCCGLETAADLEKILLIEKYDSTPHRAPPISTHAMTILSDLCLLPSVSACVSATQSFIPNLLDYLESLIEADYVKLPPRTVLLLSRLVMYDAPTARVLKRRRVVFEKISEVGEVDEIAAAVVSNIMCHEVGGGMKELAEKWEVDAKNVARFDREYGRRFDLARQAAQRRLAASLRDELAAYRSSVKPALPENIKWFAIRAAHEGSPSSPTDPPCAFCNKPSTPSEPPIPCPTCNMTFYCSTECLTFHKTSSTSLSHTTQCAVLASSRKSARWFRRVQYLEAAVLAYLLWQGLLYIFWWG